MGCFEMSPLRRGLLDSLCGRQDMKGKLNALTLIPISEQVYPANWSTMSTLKVYYCFCLSQTLGFFLFVCFSFLHLHNEENNNVSLIYMEYDNVWQYMLPITFAMATTVIIIITVPIRPGVLFQTHWNSWDHTIPCTWLYMHSN